MPYHCMWIDSETEYTEDGDTKHHTVKLAWSYYARRHKTGVYTNESWESYSNGHDLSFGIFRRSQDRSTLYLFGHNLFFDLQASGFFLFATQVGWRLDFYYDKGLTYILVIRDGSRTIKAISTTNYYPQSLKSIGDLVGLSKQEVDFADVSDVVLSEYCRTDVEIDALATEKYFSFLEQHNMGNFAMTKASQAYNAYRHRFMKRKIVVHAESDIVALERYAYFGGRTEAHYIGVVPETPICHYDVNSMYPFVMKEYTYPYRLIDFQDAPNLEKVETYLRTYHAVAQVRLKTTTPAYAVTLNGKTVFPVGDFWTGLCTEGLRFAFDHNDVVQITKIAWYEHDDLFSEYVDYFYPLKAKYKQEGNTIYAQIVKIFLNSLYGKFGQKITTEVMQDSYAPEGYYRIDNYDMVTKERWTETQLLNTLVTTGETENGKYSLVAIPAHITENARLYLWSLIERVGYERVYYMDTDSLFTHSSVQKTMVGISDNSRLGALSADRNIDELTIYGAKDYVADGVQKLKGIPARAKRIRQNVYTYDEFLRQNSHLRMQVSDHYIIRTMTKRVQRVYDKGIVTDSGFVLPFQLEAFSPPQI